MDTTNTEVVGAGIFVGGLVSFLIRTAFIALLAWIVVKMINKAVHSIKKRPDTNDMLTVYIRNILTAVVYVIAAFSILSAIVPLEGLGSAVLGATSVISVIIGLAAQETFGNFIAGFFLALSQPFSVGDLITLPEKNITGTVKQITFRHTVLQTIENSSLIIPNATMNSAVLENKVFGQDSYTRFISVSVAYDSDFALVKKLITETVMKTDRIIDQRSEEEIKQGKVPFPVRLSDFQSSGVQITFPITTKNLGDNYLAASDIREELITVFRQNHITIPYPVVEVIK
jgi:Small-conductance mechanosensitive channel